MVQYSKTLNGDNNMSLKITILDGGLTNFGDLTWDEIERFGELTVYNETDESQVKERIAQSDIVLTTRVPITADSLESAENLEYIGTFATGYNNIDLNATNERRIVVCNVPNYCTNTVAQMTFAHILELCNRVGEHTNLVRQEKWEESLSYERYQAPFFELAGKTLGIIGYGDIGRATANIARAFGMKVIAYSKSLKEIKTVNLETLFTESDIVSIHCALNEHTRNLVNLRLLMMMKPHAFIVNTARGAIINEGDLAFALNTGIIAGAGVDVYSSEPPSRINPLLDAKNCYHTPHIAWASSQARQRLITAVAKNIEGYLSGRIINQVK